MDRAGTTEPDPAGSPPAELDDRDDLSEPALEDSAVMSETFVPEDDTPARLHLLVASGFLVLAVLLGVVAAIQRAAPEFLGAIEFLEYGRVRPMAVNAFLYGWLTIGSLGAAYYILPRVGRGELIDRRLTLASLGLVAVGVLVGVVSIGLGFSEGRSYLEMPLWADAIVLLGLLAAARVITVAVRNRTNDVLGSSQVFLVGGSWWLVLVFIAGNIPGIRGVNGALQTGFYQASLLGLWLAAAGVGVLYFLVPRTSGRRRSAQTSLSVIGFWSLAFVWAATGPRHLTYGPAPDWLETVAIVFSFALLIPVGVIFADVVVGMRGRWDQLGEPTTARFVVAGAIAFGLVPLLNLLLALRSSSAIVQFTDWVAAFEHVALYGAFTLWLLAFGYHVGSKVGASGPVTGARPTTHFVLTVGGLAVAVGAMLIAGLQTGVAWAAGANSNSFVSAGEGFINSVAPFTAHQVWQAAGLGAYALGQILFVSWVAPRLAGARGPGAADEFDPLAEPDELSELDLVSPIGFGRLRFGAVGLFVVAAALVWLLPSLEQEHRDGTLRGDTVRRYEVGSLAADGRELYVELGCWYCHTQQVRPIVTDVGLGPVSDPGDYVHEAPAVLGVQRIGPDLMHAGAREPTSSVRWVFDYLKDPRAVRPWSTMPAYDHLTDSELEALATYIAGLE